MRATAIPRRLAAPAVVVGLVFWLAALSVLVIALERERRQAMVHARQEVASLAAVVEENTARIFDSVDIALSGITVYLAARDVARDDPSVREVMRARLNYLPVVRSLFVIGPDGTILHDTDFPSTPRVSMANSEYFRQYLRDPRLQQALSPAMQGRPGTGWFLAGMVFFLGAHIAYLVAFARGGALGRLRRPPLVAVPIGYAVATAAALVWMWPGLSEAGLAVPVAGYACALAAMATCAAAYGPRVAVGGGLFLVSDLLIAVGVDFHH